MFLEMCLHSFAVPWRGFLADAHFIVGPPPIVPLSHLIDMHNPPTCSDHSWTIQCLPLPCQVPSLVCFSVALLSIAIRLFLNCSPCPSPSSCIPRIFATFAPFSPETQSQVVANRNVSQAFPGPVL